MILLLRWCRTALLTACGLALTACGGLLLPPTGSPTPLPPTPSETSTPVWFPPTATPTVFPSPTAASTWEQHPGVGSLIFSDPFDQPRLWNTAVSSWAAAAVEHNRLVLSSTGLGPTTLFSLRSEPLLRDFYAEVTANVSLCLGRDQYGVIFRASPGDNYYRLALNCNGQVRMERVRSGQNEPLQDWLPSGDLPPGAPIEVRIGIWAVGDEMRFFLNDHFQFSARDPVFTSGTLGFFIAASGTTPVTAAFSNLSVYSVSYVKPTPTTFPSPTPIPVRTATP